MSSFYMNSDGIVVSNVSKVYEPSFERVKTHSLKVSTAAEPIEQPAPKYCAAMGEAAQAYCDELNAKGGCSGFRWNEVWNRMWAVRSKKVEPDSTVNAEELEKLIMEFVNSREHGTYHNTWVGLKNWMEGPGKQSVDKFLGGASS